LLPRSTASVPSVIDLDLDAVLAEISL